MKVRTGAAIALTVAVLLLTASAAYASVRVGAAIDPEYPVTHGAALITIGTNCVEAETLAPTTAEATLTVTLTEGMRSITKTETFTCEGSQDAPTLMFRGFHAGSATLEVTFTACDADNCDTGDFGGNAIPITLVR